MRVKNASKPYAFQGTNMNPFKHSLIHKIQFLGFIVSILIVFILFVTYQATKVFDRKQQVHTAIEVSNLLKKNRQALPAYLNEHAIKAVDHTEVQKELETAKVLIEDNLILSIIHAAGINLYLSDAHIIFVLKEKHETLYFSSNRSLTSSTFIKLGIYAVLLFLFLYGIYYYIKSALSPLIRLNKNIEKFSKSEDIEISYERANDEIAKVANAFYSALEYNKKLKLQRDMFVRTIMHEVKTSLTKARFITHFMKEGEEGKEKLNALIFAMQDELDKLHEFENVNTKILEMTLGSYSMNALLDDVCDVLVLEEKEIDIKAEEDVFLQVDYALFIVAIKNLVDNATKYAKDKHVQMYLNADYIEIKNLSINNKALELSKLLQPFKQEDENSSGMGLGLYLIHEIIHKHEFKLEYSLINEYHSFKIIF